MNPRSFYPLLLAVGLPLLFSSCQKDIANKQSSVEEFAGKAKQEEKTNTFKGPEVQVANGKVRSFVTMTNTGVPKEIGFEITASMLEGLPSGEGENSYIIPLHKKATEVTPFDHLELDWNPAGHPPPGIYTLPHFDFHFYKITEEEQMAIPPYTATTASMFDNFPLPGYIPEGYIPGPEGVPQMGKHWLDVTSPEFHNVMFTKTFIYGSYDGEVTFYEPMVTKAYIETTASSTTPIRQPQYFSPTNTYYPTMYNVYTDAATGKHYVSLSGFVWK